MTRHGIEVRGELRLHGLPIVIKAPSSVISLGPGVVLTGRNRNNTLEARWPCLLRTVLPGAEIVVGEDVGMTSATISAATSIKIGDRVLIGAGVVITDSDHHDMRVSESERRFASFPTPREADRVVIEDDVFIGMRSVVLKGVKIGAGSIVGAGSVVATDIPPGVVAAGNPCAVIRSI